MINQIMSAHKDTPVLYIWIICAFMFSVSIVIDSVFGLDGLAYYGALSLIPFAAFCLVTRVDGIWQADAILFLLAGSMFILFWAGVDAEVRYIGFWYNNLETMLAVLNSLELALLLSMVPWRNAWNELRNTGTGRMAPGNGEMHVQRGRQSISKIQEVS